MSGFVPRPVLLALAPAATATGVLSAAVGLLGYLMPSVRDVEEILPDQATCRQRHH